MKKVMRLIDRKIAQLNQSREEGFTAADMAKVMHIDPSLFSRWRSETQTGVTKETLRSLVLGYSDDPAEQGKLLAAFALDQIRGQPAAERVHISVEAVSSRVAESPANGLALNSRFAELGGLAADLDLDDKIIGVLMAIMRKLKGNSNLRRLLGSLARMS